MDSTSPPAHGDGLFKGTRGLKLYYQRHQPHGQARAILAIVRGSGPYRDVWDALVAAMAPSGYIVYGYDHREHTRLPGQKGYLTEWAQSQGDVREFLLLIRQQNGDGPIFLLGSGLGGLIALTYALHEPDDLTGVVAFDPAPVRTEVQPFLARVGRSLAGIWPTAHVPVANGVSPSPDPHTFERHDGLHTAPDLVTAVEETGANSGELALPHLIFRAPGQQRVMTQYSSVVQELEHWIDAQLVR